jgi:hypothetical protein
MEEEGIKENIESKEAIHGKEKKRRKDNVQSVPDRVVWVQHALFNLPVRMSSEGKYVSLYVVAVLLCCLNLFYVYLRDS